MSYFTGKDVSSNNPASTVDVLSLAPKKPVTQKSFDKSRVPSNTNNTGWCAPVGATDNLVIRFSDDDSSSDSEGCTKEKAAENKSSIIGGVSNRKPPAPSHSKLNKQFATTTSSKVMPKRLSSSRTFVSSMAKVPGPNFSGAGFSSVEQGNRRNFNSLNKNLSNRERGYDQGMGLNNSKLQDLRHQIALRESELKLKSAQRSKETVPFRDDNAVSLPRDATRKIGASSSKSSQKEPDKKRTKITGSYSNQLNSVGQQDVSVGKSILPLKEPAMQNNNVADTIKFDHGQRGNSVDRTESSIVKWRQKNGKEGAGLSENSVVLKDGEQILFYL